MISFFVKCSPPKSLSKNSKQLFVRGGFARMTDSKSTKDGKDTILQLLAPYAPPEPLSGPVSMTLEFCYPFPKSTSKKELALGSRPMVTRPDVDGIASGVLDCMTTLRFFNDDSQVYTLTVTKRQSDSPGVTVLLEES